MTTRMLRALVLAVGTIIALAGAVGSFGETLPQIGHRGFAIDPGAKLSEYCSADEFIEERLALIVGFPSLSKSDVAAKAALECVVSLWPALQHEPAANGVSNAFLALLLVNPEVFYSAMAAHRDVLDSWLSDLDVLSFTWSHEGPCGLDAYRQRVVSVTTLGAASDRQSGAVKTQVVRRLKSLSCHLVR